MKLIVGLGNPGSEYDKTRHNVGFRVVDRIASSLKEVVEREKWNALYTTIEMSGEKVCLIKPQTFMNLSGDAVGRFFRFHKLEPQDMLVVHDELDLPLGRLKLSSGSRSGGHNGVQSIIETLGTSDFFRLRIGISKPEGKVDVSHFVLSPFSKEERDLADEMIVRSASASVDWVSQGAQWVMQTYHGVS